jgi:hypothetical protein
MKNFYDKYKSLIWISLVIALVIVVIWTVYRIVVFQVIGTSPAQNAKISAGRSTITINLNSEIEPIDANKQIIATSGLTVKADTDKNKIVLTVTNIVQDKKYEIQIKNIKSKSGKSIDYYKYSFEGGYVPYSSLSQQQKNQQLQQTDRGNYDDPAMAILPKVGDNYTIDYETYSEPVLKGKYIKLIITLLLRDDQSNDKNLELQYKNEALNYLKSNGINPNDYVIQYHPESAASL